MSATAPHPLRSVLAAYGFAGTAWREGPAAVMYGSLAEMLVERSPVGLAHRLVLDAGSGAGAASHALRRVGAIPVALDGSIGMLMAQPWELATGIAADVTALPFAPGSVDGLAAAFSFNHVPNPVKAFAEARRVCRGGAPVLASVFGAGDQHPVKAAVDRAARELGWRPAGWYHKLSQDVMPLLATPEALTGAAAAGGVPGRTEHLVVEFTDLTPEDLVQWRLGMPQFAAFTTCLGASARDGLVQRALELLGDRPPPLTRSVLMFAGVCSSGS